MNRYPLYFSQSSERLEYRKLTVNDIEDWKPFFWDKERLPFLGIDTSKTGDALAKEWINKQLNRYTEEGLGLLAVIEKKSSQLIGMCGILPREINDQAELEIGYSFLPKHRGKGFATEAAIQMRQFGESHEMANRFISIIHKDNTDSMKVARKNAMKELLETTYLDIPVIIFST